MELKDMSLEEIISEIKESKVTKKEVFDYFMDRIKKYDKQLWAFNSINKDWLNDNDWILCWIPIWLKDLYCEKWIRTTGASVMLEGFVPPYESTLTSKLKDAWMSSIWKTNMDQFAMWSSWENSAFGNVFNPWGEWRTPGWSSSGSAAAVAAWLVPATLWTDTWWSIRQPASLCWIVWFRPSYGRNSRYWVFPMASSFDCPGTFTRTVKDAALLYGLMNGEDSKENTTIPWKDEINENIWETKDLKWIKLWVPKEYFEEWLDEWVKKTIEEAIEHLKSLWAEIKEVSLPMTKYAMAAYYIIVPAEVSTNLARLDGIRYGHNSEEHKGSLEELYLNNRWEGLWDEPKRRSIIWSYVLSSWFYDAYFIKASKVRTLIIEDFKKAFSEVDALITPVSPEVAWKLWEKVDDPLKLYLADAYTVPSALAWLPWISVPCWFAESEDDEKEKMPVWLQIIAPYLHEQRLFEIANVYEQSAGWREKMIPKGFE